MKKYFLYFDPCNGPVILKPEHQKGYLDWAIKNGIPTALVTENTLERCTMRSVSLTLVAMGETKGHPLYVGCN